MRPTTSYLSMAFGLALLSVSCTRYTSLTVPPPGRVADLHGNDERLEISSGVAFAFECRTQWGGRCSRQVSVTDPKIAEVHPAYLDDLDWYRGGQFIPSSYVVVGVSPGETTLTVEGEDPLRIVVLP